MKSKSKSTKVSKKRNKFKKWRNRCIIIFLSLGIICLLGFGVFWALNFVFGIKEIYAENSAKYDKNEIILASKIKKGDNLCLLSPTKCEMEIYKNLAYIDEAKVYKIFPNKVKIEVSSSDIEYTLFNENEYLLVSKKGKVVESRSEAVPEVTNLRGINFSVSEMGKVVYEKPQLKKFAETILNSFEEVGLKNVNFIDFTDTNNIVLGYDQRIKVLFGTEENLEFKALTAHEIIVNKIKFDEKGTLDLRNLKKDNKSYFISDTD